MFNNLLNSNKLMSILRTHSSSTNLFSKVNWFLSSIKLNSEVRLYIDYIGSLSTKYKNTLSNYNHTALLFFVYSYISVSIIIEVLIYAL